jgi:hypothetical protein
MYRLALGEEVGFEEILLAETRITFGLSGYKGHR